MLSEGVLARLNTTEWFSHVGELVESARCRSILSWYDSFRYSGDEITKWCSMQAGLCLYNKLASLNYERFCKWNEIARGYAKDVDVLVAKAMSIPGVPNFPTYAKSHLKSQLIGALMEEAYDDVLSVTLCREQVNLLVNGHFPCGWDVSSADDFPEKAVILVF